MNAQTFAHRIDAIVNGLGANDEYQVTSPINGKAITLYKRNNVLMVTTNGYTSEAKGDLFTVRNKALELAGY